MYDPCIVPQCFIYVCSKAIAHLQLGTDWQQQYGCLVKQGKFEATQLQQQPQYFSLCQCFQRSEIKSSQILSKTTKRANLHISKEMNHQNQPIFSDISHFAPILARVGNTDNSLMLKVKNLKREKFSSCPKFCCLGICYSFG